MFNELARGGYLSRSVLVSTTGSSRLFGKAIEQDALGVVEWHMPSSQEPPSYSISVPSHHELRDLIRASGVFVVNFMGAEHSRRIDFVSQKSGAFSDLFNFLKVTKEEASKVFCTRVREARAHVECEVSQEIESGDHTVFVGRIVGTSMK
jgi:flavin reductase (DIM6/NTAB) family NADH-FMN oxidoreductase RutF